MAIFYTSDLHIGHKTVAGHRGFTQMAPYMAPPGEEQYDVMVAQGDPYAHDEALAEYWDATVKSEDTVFVLGDTGMSRFESYVLPWFDARSGRKHLITGNHDPVHPSRSDALNLQQRWLRTFDTINPYLTRKISGRKIMLSHFPYQSYGDGTTHGEPGGRWNEWRIPEELGKLLLHGHTHGPERIHDGNQFHVGWDAWGRFVTHEQVVNWVQSIGD